jgi:hypothetical protein
MTKQLFPAEKRESFNWQAYLSSALTIQDAQTRDRIKQLNSFIKKWLEEGMLIAS